MLGNDSFFTCNDENDKNNSPEPCELKNNHIFDRYGFIWGEQYMNPLLSKVSETELIKLKKRELKWQSVLMDWKTWMSKEPQRVRKRCRKGIPSSFRPRIWQYLCGSHYDVLFNSKAYDELLNMPVDNKISSEIKLDIHRQLPNHIYFVDEMGYGQQSLFNLLTAYCKLRPDNGYCQAQAPIAASLLIHMPEEQAFWTFVKLCDHYLVDYFKPGLTRVQMELNMLKSFVQKYQPKIYKHFVEHKIEPVYFAVDWFMCLFTRNLPWPTVLRILDMFFFEGVRVLFRISLAIFHLLLGTNEARNELNSMDKVLSALRRLPFDITQEDVLIPCSMRYTKINPQEYINSFKNHLKLHNISKESMQFEVII